MTTNSRRPQTKIRPRGAHGRHFNARVIDLIALTTNEEREEVRRRQGIARNSKYGLLVKFECDGQRLDVTYSDPVTP